MKTKKNLRSVSALTCFVVVVFLSLFSTLFFRNQVSAAPTDQDLRRKALLNGLDTCYLDKYTKPSIPEDEFGDVSAIFTSDGRRDKVISVPSLSGGSDQMTCQKVFDELVTTATPIDSSTITSIGYRKTTGKTSSDKGCLQFSYFIPSTTGITTEDNRQSTNQLCLKINQNDNTISGVATNTGSPADLRLELGQNSVVIIGRGIEATGNMEVNYLGKTWDQFANEFREKVNQISGYSPYNGQAGSENKYSLDSVSIDRPEGGVAQYEKIKPAGQAASAARNYFSNGSSDQDGRKYSEDEEYAMYTQYLNNYLGKGVTIDSTKCNVSKETARGNSSDGLVLKVGNEWCPVNGASSVSGTNFNVVNSGGTGLENADFATMMKKLEKISDSRPASETAKIDSSGKLTNVGTTPVTPGGSTDPPSDSGVPECTNVSGVLSWMFCPVLRFAGEAVSEVYGWIEDSFLAIKSSFMDTTSGTYKGWSAFRNIANILFAILFLIVIFAQITGIGISNYNIKKMLPRLIIVVVLVNVSFILCQLAVDISNIVGSQLNSGLSNLGKDLPQFDLGKIGEVTNALVDQTASASSNVGALLGLTTITTLTAVTWKLWLLPFFLAIISAVIGVMFFFLILGVRQAGVMIAVVLAPLAIVCYALPNTKSLYDKWWKLFSALLMVYPICGALMGGGKFAGNLMIQNAGEQGFMYVLIAMLLTILPFFAVPSILKGSLQGLGNLGAKISNFGSGINKAATGGIRGSAGFKDAQKQLQYGRAQDAEKRYEFGQRAGAYLRGTKVGGAIANSGFGKFVAGSRVGRAVSNRSARMHAQNQRTLMEGRRAQFAADNIGSTIAGEDAKEMEMLIKNADAALQNDKGINAENVDDLGAAYDNTLKQLRENPEDRNARANLIALQNRLASTDPGRARLQHSLLTAMKDSSDSKSDTAIVQAVQQLQATKGGILKANSPDFAKLVQTVASTSKSSDGSYNLDTLRGSIDIKKATDADGHEQFYSKKFLNDSIAKIDEAKIASMDETAFDRLDAAIKSGDLSGTTLQNLMSVMDSALSGKGNVVLQTGQRNRINQLLGKGYAQKIAAQTRNADGSYTVGKTESSEAMRTASVTTTNNAVAAISATNKDGKFVLDDDTVRGMAQNASAILNMGDAEYTAEKAAAINNLITAARERGIKNTDGSDFQNIEPSSISYKVQGAPVEQKAPELPPDWHQEEVTVGRGPNRRQEMRWKDGDDNYLSAEDAEHANAILQAQREIRVANLRNGFSGRIRRGGSGGGPTGGGSGGGSAGGGSGGGSGGST